MSTKETGLIAAAVAVVAWVISSGTKHMQSESKRTPRPPAAPPAASGAGRFVDMASARREGAGNPHDRCRSADRARRLRALLSGLPGWRCTVGCVRLRAPSPEVPGLWESVRPRLLENGACRAGAGSDTPMKYQRRRRADLSGRMLRGEDLREVDWRDAKLVGADLSGALLNGADLSNADLTGALLVGADLYGATLCSAVLRDANLRDAKIRAVDLNDADLTGADLSDAQLNRGGRGGKNNPRRPTDLLGAKLVGDESEPCQYEPCADGAR